MVEAAAWSKREILARLHVSSAVLASDSRFFRTRFTTKVRDPSSKEISVQVWRPTLVRANALVGSPSCAIAGHCRCWFDRRKPNFLSLSLSLSLSVCVCVCMQFPPPVRWRTYTRRTS